LLFSPIFAEKTYSYLYTLSKSLIALADRSFNKVY